VSSPLLDLEPRSLWQHFDDIRKIPRRSGREGRIRAHMKAFAAAHGLEALEDAVGNVCLKVPATPGHESAPPVVIQGHLDMVCEKNTGTAFDFDTDPIDVVVDGDWVKARGTTLGADNGLGLAAALACVTDESVVHPRLELLFTVDEETGLTGAMRLDASLLTGQRLLNLDSEDDGVLFVGCAGGRGTTLRLPLAREAAPAGTALELFVRGLRGGHSGLDIGENRANALKLVARALEAAASTGVAIASFDGGSAHNAIPREAKAVVVVGDRAAFERAVEGARAAALAEHGAADPEIRYEITAVARPAQVFARAAAETLVRLVLALPYGVLAMSRDLEGLVETSNNVSTLSTAAGEAVLLLSSRSSVASALTSTVGQIRAVGLLAGAQVVEHEGYPGWQPNMASELLGVAREVFTGIWGRPPKVTAIHAGLECGLIGERVPGMDMISFGPQLKAVHSPDERAQISSSARFFEALRELLARLA
jgi:dipeptidase D